MRKLTIRLDVDARESLETLALEHPGVSFSALARMSVLKALRPEALHRDCPAVLVLTLPNDITPDLERAGESASEVVREIIKSHGHE